MWISYPVLSMWISGTSYPELIQSLVVSRWSLVIGYEHINRAYYC